MKNIINKTLLALGIQAMMLASCSKDFITQYPHDSVPTSQALNDISSLQTALNGAYAQLRSTSLFGRDFAIIGDLQADNTFIEVKNSGRYLTQFNYTATNSDG